MSERATVSLAWYIVLKEEMAGVDSSVSGTALAHSADLLDSLAKDANVKPLMEFFSASPNDLAQFADDHEIDIAAELPPESWFSAADGLTTVRALLRQVEETEIDQAHELLSDLQDFARVLGSAAAQGVGWHLAVDF